MKPMDTLRKLTDAANAFRDDRDWRQFHTPKDLAVGLSLEASEVLEHFLWKNNAQVSAYLEAGGTSALKKEMADVMIYLLFMAHDLGIDLEQAVLDKLEENARKYPVEQAKGRSDKYTAYQQAERA